MLKKKKHLANILKRYFTFRKCFKTKCTSLYCFIYPSNILAYYNIYNNLKPRLKHLDIF